MLSVSVKPVTKDLRALDQQTSAFLTQLPTNQFLLSNLLLGEELR
jgi:hypothetical protein